MKDDEPLTSDTRHFFGKYSMISSTGEFDLNQYDGKPDQQTIKH